MTIFAKATKFLQEASREVQSPKEEVLQEIKWLNSSSMSSRSAALAIADKVRDKIRPMLVKALDEYYDEKLASVFRKHPDMKHDPEVAAYLKKRKADYLKHYFAGNDPKLW